MKAISKRSSCIPRGRQTQSKVVKATDVSGAEIDLLKRRLQDQMNSPELAMRTFDWLQPRLKKLKGTLTLDTPAREKAKEEAVQAVGEKLFTYQPGQAIAPAGKPLDLDNMALLQLEYAAMRERLSPVRQLGYSLASLGMFVALSVLCGVYVLCYERDHAPQHAAVCHHAVPARRHRRAQPTGSPRYLAGGSHSAVAVRHDRGDRLSAGIGAAVLGRRGAGDRRGHWAGARRIRHADGGRFDGRAAGGPDSQPRSNCSTSVAPWAWSRC